MASGDTKTEAMLNVLGNGGSGDEFRGCCNTKTQSYILDAIDRINAIQPGGTSDFNDLENRPQLNGTAMTGNTNITNFTGTDGTNAGAQGLVPAPAAADADKFLKSDGTWADVGGGSQIGGTILTSEMYNYPAGNPDGVALWLLPAGVYYLASSDNTTKVYRTNHWSRVGSDEYSTYFVSQQANGQTLILLVHPRAGTLNVTTESNVTFEWYRININTGTQSTSWFEPNSGQALLTNSDVKDSLTSTARWLPLSANQGKVLKDLIDALDARVTALEGGNASQSSSSSAEPEPEPGGGSAQAPTYPYYEGTHVFYLYNGQEVYYDETSPVQDLYYRDGTLAMAEADWCQDEGQGTVYYCGGGGEMEPVEPGPEIPPEEPTEEPVEG